MLYVKAVEGRPSTAFEFKGMDMRYSMFRYNILFAGVLILLGGCASSSKGGRTVNDDIQDLRSIQAQQTADLNKFKDELRIIRGQIEEIQYQSLGRTEELERTVKQLGSRVPPPAGVPEDILNDDEQQIGRIPGDASSLYISGLNALRSGDFSQAEQIFVQFVAGNPDTAFTDNALLWLGICYEKLGQMDRAVLMYSDVYQKFPAEDRVPVALYRLGDVFLTLGSKDEAKLAFQKIVDDHRGSSIAKQAKEKLAALKTSSKKR